MSVEVDVGTKILEGIAVGGAGRAFAGFIIWLFQWGREKMVERELSPFYVTRWTCCLQKKQPASFYSTPTPTKLKLCLS